MSEQRWPDGEFEFTSRYDVFGPPNGCKGPCDGTGWVPVYLAEGDHDLSETRCHPANPETDARLIAAWREAEAKRATEDGWHFVRCPDCLGGRS